MANRAVLRLDPFDLHATFAMQLLGKFDPSGRRGTASLRKVHLDAHGKPIIWRFTHTDDSLVIDVEGDDGTLLDSMTRQFPLADGAESFEPAHPLLKRLSKGFRGLRLMQMPWPFDVAAGAVLQQRVRWQTAYADFRRIALKWGTRIGDDVAFPTSSQLAAVPIYRLEALGLDPKRARALHLLSCADARHAFLQPGARDAAIARRLLSIRGIGPWTTAHVTGVAYGDPDAVIVGDLHLPSLVTLALAGEAEGTDERMLELLEPYAGQRFRVLRLLMWAARRTPHVLREAVPR